MPSVHFVDALEGMQVSRIIVVGDRRYSQIPCPGEAGQGTGHEWQPERPMAIRQLLTSALTTGTIYYEAWHQATSTALPMTISGGVIRWQLGHHTQRERYV